MTQKQRGVFMLEAAVFQGLNVLDSEEVRSHVVRVPDVIHRIQEAQDFWDKSGNKVLDFFNFIASEDRIFLSNIRLKSLAASIIQVGLYDRYLRHHQRPQIFVGNTNGDMALFVAMGKISFSEMISSSPALKMLQPISFSVPHLSVVTPILSGISLTQYGAFRSIVNDHKEVRIEELQVDKIDPNKIISMLVRNCGVKRFINIGPGNLLYPQLEEDLRNAEIQVLESIELDPMLSWFWLELRRKKFALAQ